ncbi:wall-associated receptor kinase-like 20 [Actinidia eriantha]|uniref:wall-associated receptor kinase-like 20 n=1 Tax=Actinidia eriantha TaxID=165200 RepID=UPI002583B96A|nr:wall-associated receptor kinase-like 20 [Actinidia eriantha]
MAPTPNPLVLAAALLMSAGLAGSVTRCPDCGTTQVPYPLSTGPNCGDQSYKIQCNAGALKFDTLNNTYPITAITPETQRFVIQPASFLPNACVTADLPTLGIRLNASLPFTITSSNTIMYLNCTPRLLNSPLNCSAASVCHSYVNGTGEAAACGREPICCTFRAGWSTNLYRIRIRNSGCRAYRSFVNLDPQLPVSRWPRPGMEIKWVSPLEPVCGAPADCDSNSMCGSDPAGNGLRRCYCNSGLRWDPVGGLCAENMTCQDPDGCEKSTGRTALIAGLIAGLGTALVAAIIGFSLYKRHRCIREAQERLTREREESLNANGGAKSAKIFTGEEFKRATNNLSRDRLQGAGV